jgi:hypothetical protein
MAQPSALEALTIAVATPVEDLVYGDNVGPVDVSLPIDFVVVGVPERTIREKQQGELVALRASAGSTARTYIPGTVVYVRRYRAIATITRADGTVDATRRTIRLRPIVGDAVTPISTTTMQLRPGDSFTLSAT